MIHDSDRAYKYGTPTSASLNYKKHIFPAFGQHYQVVTFHPELQQGKYCGTSWSNISHILQCTWKANAFTEHPSPCNVQQTMSYTNLIFELVQQVHDCNKVVLYK